MAHRIKGRARAMIVTRSRLHAVRYRLALDRTLKERGLPYEALVAFSGTVRDPDSGLTYTESQMNGLPDTQTRKAFERPDVRFLVVANKFQTGFDQPLVHTMYVDKKLGGVIGLQGAMATVSVISRAVGYTETAVRDALKDMVLARLVRETRDRPARYRALHRPWVDLLELDVPGENEDGCGPAWGMWPPLFSLLHALHGLGATVVSGEESGYVVASAARDAIERSRHAFEFHGIDLPELDRYPGRSFVEALLEITESVSAWTEEHP